MKLTTLFIVGALMLLLNGRCTQQVEPSVDNFERITLKPGESHQVKVNDAVYKIMYDSTRVEFAEGVSRENTSNYYVKGDIKLVINNESVSLIGIGNYDNKGIGRSWTWVDLEDRKLTKSIGAITIGAANVYPASKNLTLNVNYAIDLIIQKRQ